MSAPTFYGKLLLNFILLDVIYSWGVRLAIKKLFLGQKIGILQNKATRIGHFEILNLCTLLLR